MTPSPEQIVENCVFLVFELIGAIAGAGIMMESLGALVSLRAIGFEAWGLNMLFAGALGLLAGRRWNHAVSRWIWVPAVVWFLFRALSYSEWHETSLLLRRGGVWEHFSGRDCPENWNSCTDFLVVTVPVIRAVSYSAAAYLYSAFHAPRVSSQGSASGL